MMTAMPKTEQHLFHRNGRETAHPRNGNVPGRRGKESVPQKSRLPDRAQIDHRLKLLAAGAADPAVIERGIAVLIGRLEHSATEATVILNDLSFHFDQDIAFGGVLLCARKHPLAALASRRFGENTLSLPAGSRLAFSRIAFAQRPELPGRPGSPELLHGTFQLDLKTSALTAADRPRNASAPAPDFLQLETALARSLADHLHCPVLPGPSEETTADLALVATAARIEPDSETTVDFRFDGNLAAREEAKIDRELRNLFPRWFFPLADGFRVHCVSLSREKGNLPMLTLRF